MDPQPGILAIARQRLGTLRAKWTFALRVARVAGIETTIFELPDHKVVRRATRWLTRRAHEVLGEDDSLPDAKSIEIAKGTTHTGAREQVDPAQS